MEIIPGARLAPLVTFQMGGTAEFLIKIQTIADLKEAFTFTQEKKLPVIVLGGGSNVLIKEGLIEAVILKIEIPGFLVVNEHETSVDIEVGAGEVWDSVVARTVAMGLSGIEALSAIPGTAGATPIQNVGAYGQEIKNTLISLTAYEIETGEIKTFLYKDCRFGYRDSVFKHEARGKYVILSITLRLSKYAAEVPNYPGVKKYFEEKEITEPTLAEIREAIIAIRSNKLPDPKEIASVGSFFKNPFVDFPTAERLRSTYPLMPCFPTDDERYKLSAGWLIETLGWKGKDFGNLMIYPGNALVLVNKGMATFRELEIVVSEIKSAVSEKFGVSLEEEPIYIP